MAAERAAVANWPVDEPHNALLVTVAMAVKPTQHLCSLHRKD